MPSPPGRLAEGPAAEQYSPLTGFVYVFNLIVGTGALTLPAAFHDAGLQRLKRSGGSVASDDLIQRSLQAQQDQAEQAPGPQQQEQAAAEASPVAGRSNTSPPSGRATPSNFHYVNRATTSNEDDDEDGGAGGAGDREPGENEPLIGYSSISPEAVERIPRNVSAYYNIGEVVEMGKMASMFFNRTGRTLFYVCITVYLYGDLAIYGAAVAKSLRDVACTYRPANATPFNMSDTEICWQGEDLTRLDAYRIALAVFVGVVGPFAFCNVQKTKYLQIFTTLMRWLAFGCMVALACIRLAKGLVFHPPVANLAGLPNLFGVCVYSFMCHHSLPSLVTPISRKGRLSSLLLTDYALILSFYFLLAFTGIFTFAEINDLYTLNFQPKPGEEWGLAAVHYFLSLFPVFTLSTNFPIIAITLRNNLRALFLTEGRMYSWCTRQCIFPLLALVPPVAVAFATNSLEFLVGITGSYAGAGIQYIVPAFLVHLSRRRTNQAIGVGVRNHHRSYFRSTFWVVFVNLWAVGSVVLVTWNHIANKS